MQSGEEAAIYFSLDSVSQDFLFPVGGFNGSKNL